MSQHVVMLVHVVHVGSVPCPLSLPVYEFIGAGESGNSGYDGDCPEYTHGHCSWCAVGREIRKLKV